MNALGAVWLLAVLAAEPPAAQVESPAKVEEALAHFKQGTAFYNLNMFPEALREFQAAYLAKQDPAFLYNIAQCHRQTGKHQEALAFYRNYLRTAKDPPNRVEVERRIAEMERAVEVHPAGVATGVAPAAASAVSPPVAPVLAAPAASTPPPTIAPPPPPTVAPPPPPAATPAAAPATPPLATTPPAGPSPAAPPVAARASIFDATLQTTAPPPVAAPSPFYERWWFWTAVAAVVVGGAVGGVLLSRDPTCPEGVRCQ